jgi:hypothetical protein
MSGNTSWNECAWYSIDLITHKVTEENSMWIAPPHKASINWVRASKAFKPPGIQKK